MIWFLDAYLFIGTLLCFLMRWNWGARIRTVQYVATLLLWPYIIFLGLIGKL